MWTYPPSRILVPVSFEDASARALRLASAIATRLGAMVIALHADAVDVPTYFTPAQIVRLERERVAARSERTRALARFAEAAGAAPVEARVIERPPVAAILDAAADADLIVMATHGRRGPSRWWLGSVAEAVLHDLPAPLLVIRSVDAPSLTHEVFERMLLVAAVARRAGEVDRYARNLAAALGGRILETHAGSPVKTVAREQEATLLVVAAPTRHGHTRAGGT